MLTINPSKEAVTKAIEILCAECAGAMRMANAFGGHKTPEWELIHANSLTDILAEGDRLGLDYEAMKCAVTGTPLTRSAYYLQARGIIDKEKKSRIFQYVKNSEDGHWPEHWQLIDQVKASFFFPPDWEFSQCKEYLEARGYKIRNLQQFKRGADGKIIKPYDKRAWWAEIKCQHIPGVKL